MSAVPVKYQSTRANSTMAQMFMSIYKILRLAFVCTFMLMVMLVSIIYSVNQALFPRMGGGPAQNATTQSPLQNLLTKERSLQEELRKSDCDILKNINDRSNLEVKTLVIAETIVPYEEREKLGKYVWKQLESSDVVSTVQASALATLVNLAPTEASLSKQETGQMGTLRNSALLALIKRNLNNIHFLMVGVRAEPRLRWRWISPAERNVWNDVLSRVLNNKVRAEAQNYLLERNFDDVPEVVKRHATDQLALQSLLHEGTDYDISDK